MDLASILIIGALVLIVPLVLFLGLVGFGIAIWSWKRIGPYFVSFGRWVADWRNFVPLGCVGVLAIVFLVLVAAILPDSLSILRIILLALVAVAGFVFIAFAVLLWTVRLIGWLWPRFRRDFWLNLQRMWDFVSKGVSGERRGKRRPPGERQPARQKVSEKRPQMEPSSAASSGASPAARGVSPRGRSWLDMSWLAALIWGKRQQPGGRSGAVPRSPEAQSQVTVVAPEPNRLPRVSTKPKPGLRPLMWRLGLLGRPRNVRRPKPGATQGMTAAPAKPAPPPAAAASQPRPVVAAPAPRPAQVKPKPTAVIRAKPKRGLFAPVRGVGMSVTGSLEGVRKAFWVGVFWVGRNIGAGINAVLRLLHLGGKRR